MTARKSGSRQGEFIPRSKMPVIRVDPNHLLVQLADRLDWTELLERVEQFRLGKMKNAAGRLPHLRAMTGAIIVISNRRVPYRDAEDLIQHYGPARYLCGLTETDWTPDYRTIHDFAKMLGEEGHRLINEYVVGHAVELGLADPTLAVADTTAQEAAIPYPNEMGLMSQFLSSVERASKRAGSALKRFGRKVKGKIKKAKRNIREYRLFAKTHKAKKKLMEDVAGIVESVQDHLDRVFGEMSERAARGLRKYGQVAFAKVVNLHETMKELLPQIRKWLRTGKVATGKIVSLHIPQLYSIVRGKVGKKVEFGLRWGITRLKGGFVLGTVAKKRGDVLDSSFALEAVQDLKEKYGKAPEAYAYDRGGYSAKNISELRKIGVKQVGVAPRGKARWRVGGKVKEKLVSERAQVEGNIGTVKSSKYGFNRPGAHSVDMMGACGQRAMLGFNLNKMMRDLRNAEMAAESG